MEPTETFWITMSGIITAFLGVVLRYAYKSKCQKVDFCGVHIERDIESERIEDLEANRQQDTITNTGNRTERNSMTTI